MKFIKILNHIMHVSKGDLHVNKRRTNTSSLVPEIAYRDPRWKWTLCTQVCIDIVTKTHYAISLCKIRLIEMILKECRSLTTLGQTTTICFSNSTQVNNASTWNETSFKKWTEHRWTLINYMGSDVTNV